MEVWLWAVIRSLVLIVAALLMKIYLLRKSAKEIEEGFADRLVTDTNVLIDISSRDRYMRSLANAVNTQLVQLKKEHHRFYTVETARKSTGLGLAIAKTLAEQMHGTVDARYEDGRLAILISL